MIKRNEEEEHSICFKTHTPSISWCFWLFIHHSFIDEADRERDEVSKSLELPKRFSLRSFCFGNYEFYWILNRFHYKHMKHHFFVKFSGIWDAFVFLLGENSSRTNSMSFVSQHIFSVQNKWLRKSMLFSWYVGEFCCCFALFLSLLS